MEKTPYFEKLDASEKGIKDKRAIASQNKAMKAMYNIVLAKQNKVEELEAKIMDNEDFYPETNDSLRPTKQDFNEAEWASDAINLDLDLDQAKIELENAKKTYKRWFRNVTPANFLSEKKGDE